MKKVSIIANAWLTENNTNNNESIYMCDPINICVSGFQVHYQPKTPHVCDSRLLRSQPLSKRVAYEVKKYSISPRI